LVSTSFETKSERERIYMWAKQQRAGNGKENIKLFCYRKARDLVCHTVTWTLVLGYNKLVI